MRNSWEGQTSDLHVFQARAQALMTAFAHTPSPQYLGAAAQLYHADPAPHRQNIGFITRLPNTLAVVSQGMRPALQGATWHPVDDRRRSQRLD